VVVITFDRIGLLEQTMQHLRAKSRYRPTEVILCDDGSPPVVQARYASMGFDLLLLESRNRGLGHNQNKGIRAAKGDYVLHLQDDWECRGPSDFIEAGIELLEERPDVGLVRYYDEPKNIPFKRHISATGRVSAIFQSKDLATQGHFGYSDTPHLKRRNFHERFGSYAEGVSMTAMEIEMREAFAAQGDVHVGFLSGYAEWRHLGGGQSRNPSGKRAKLRASLMANPVTRGPFRLFLLLRGRKL
jgi:glycosyltransferase involved in cell wall biosynthesis